MALTDDDRELMELQKALSASGAAPAGLPSGAAIAADPDVIRTWELRQAAQREAYGQYVANGDIWIGNCLTFAAGMAVPLEHVIRFNLLEREQVNRVATPEMAKRGKAFESDEEFLKANPHIARQLRQPKAGDLHPSALDPRGGGAAVDDARKAGKTVDAPTYPGDPSDDRQEAVAAAAENLAGDDGDTEKSKSAGGKSGGSKSRRTTGSGSTSDATEKEE